MRLVCGFDSHTTLYASRFVKGKASLCVLDEADMASSGWPQVIGTVAENFRELTHLFAPKLSHWFVYIDLLWVQGPQKEWLAGKWYDKPRDNR